MSNHVHLLEVLSIPESPQTVATNHVEPQLKADLKRLIIPVIEYFKIVSKNDIWGGQYFEMIVKSLPELEKLVDYSDKVTTPNYSDTEPTTGEC